MYGRIQKGFLSSFEETQYFSYQCYEQFVNLHKLQNILRNFEIVHVQFAHFWPKPNCNPKPKPNSKHSQTVQHIMKTAQTHKLHTTSALLLEVVINKLTQGIWPKLLRHSGKSQHCTDKSVWC